MPILSQVPEVIFKSQFQKCMQQITKLARLCNGVRSGFHSCRACLHSVSITSTDDKTCTHLSCLKFQKSFSNVSSRSACNRPQNLHTSVLSQIPDVIFKSYATDHKTCTCLSCLKFLKSLSKPAYGIICSVVLIIFVRGQNPDF